VNNWKLAATAEDMWQYAFAADMHDDENGGIDIGRQMFDQLAQSFDSAGGSADDNDVAFGHQRSALQRINGIAART
jgi:hypothetical protein